MLATNNETHQKGYTISFYQAHSVEMVKDGTLAMWKHGG